ncbi:PIN domain-containing protein [Dyadobacter sp. CY326]|uniref:PIN domain-containing protein n=1 Tax=Dyadobacter sp. CY326 TaxID=2907300 RepID=UPI001F2C5775|nr:PIN domain-containing protein [Dyadobacter sp. CY326]MCE7065609.1 PIN domain-containing protein [Dyadobacter sp. CY326]
MTKIAVDTNILIYLHEEPSSNKTVRAKEIITESPVISAQVISEYLNVLKRLLKVPKLRLIEHCLVLVEACEIAPIDSHILAKSKQLLVRYDFQLFDSIIVASALEANCSILYSEDLQHNQLIENKLTIINPFI